MDERTSYEVTGKFVVRKIVDECILVPVSPQLKQRDTLLVLNDTAARLLSGIIAGDSYSTIEAKFLAEFDLDPVELEKDFSEFVGTMIAMEAIRARSQSD